MKQAIHVLLIEDNPGDARLVQEELRSAPSKTRVQLEWVDRLEKGLERLASNHLDAILIDLNLPDSQGLDTLQRVLSHAPQIPAIVITGQADEEMGMQAVQVGAQDYLVKGQVDGRMLLRSIQYATQRKQTEMQLAAALAFTEHMLTSSPVGILTYRLSGECTSANAHVAEMVGATVDQLKKQNFRELESWKRSGLYDLAEQAIASKKLIAADVHVITTFGKDLWVRAQFVTFRSEGEELLLLTVLDITERKRAEDALRESEDNFRQLFEAESDAIFLIENQSGQILQANHAACVLYGYTREELLTKKNTDLSAEPEQTHQVTTNTPVLADQIVTIPLRYHRKKDGTVIPVEITGRFFLHQDRPVHIAAIRDITERKQAEEALAASEARYRSLFESNPHPMWVYDMDTLRFLAVNDAAVEHYGYSREEFLSMTIREIRPAEDVPALIENVKQNTGVLHAPSVWRHLKKDRTLIDVEISSHAVQWENASARLVLAHDITERKRAEIALQEKEHLLSEAQRIGHIGSWSYHILTDTLQYSDEMYRLFDISAEAFEHNLKAFLDLIHSSDRSFVAQWMDGIRTRGQAKEVEFLVLCKNNELRYIRCRGAVEFDRSGKPARFIGTAQDVTERKLAEIQIRQQIERLTALSTIDSAIASGFDLQITLDILLSQTIAQLHVDASAVLLLDPNMQTLEYAAWKGFSTQIVEGICLRVASSQAGQAVRERQAIHIENLENKPEDTFLARLRTAEDFISYVGLPVIVKGKVKGVLEIFQRAPLHPYPEWLDFLHTLAGQAAIAIENTQLFKNLQHTNEELVQAYDATIEGWSRAMDLRDHETEGHTQRVTSMTLTLAQSMGIEDAQLMHMRRGALLHDIGKLGIPDEILLKRDDLTEEEWAIMRKHPQFASEMLVSIPYLKPALDIPYCHHEKWDGTGYPRGLKGPQIPLSARIFAIVDVWDALCSDRPYRKAWSVEQAREYIRSQAGTHFDPLVVEHFLHRIKV